MEFLQILSGALLALALVILPPAPAEATDNEIVAAELLKLFDAGKADTGSSDVNSKMAVVRDYYASRNFKPIWVRDNGPKSKAKALLKELSISSVHGLSPQFYNTDEIAGLMESTRPEELARLDMLLSGAVVEFGQDLRNGRIGPAHPEARNAVVPVEFDPGSYLEGAADAGNFRNYASGFLNADDRYVRLIAKLSELQRIDISGRWPKLAVGAPYTFDQIRDLLVLTGDLPPEDFSVSAFTDKGTRTAIRLFQKRHSIAVTGEMDDATLAAMAVPPSRRISQILVNLERRRWQNVPLGDDHLYVNLADHTVRLTMDGRTASFAEFEDSASLRDIPTSYGVLEAFEEGDKQTVAKIRLDPAPQYGKAPTSLELKITPAITMKAPMQVFVTYITAWVSSSGQLYFANDAENRDKAVAALLKLDQ
ncbi:MAG: peptidoglycan-binding protein [Nitratireductor sp.]|nr:peptidoglycan-binding protein [Nitratireductor sp.]